MPVVKELRYLFSRFYIFCMVPGVQDFMEGCPTSQALNMVLLCLTGISVVLVFVAIVVVRNYLRSSKKLKLQELRVSLYSNETFRALQEELFGESSSRELRQAMLKTNVRRIAEVDLMDESFSSFNKIRLAFLKEEEQIELLGQSFASFDELEVSCLEQNLMEDSVSTINHVRRRSSLTADENLELLMRLTDESSHRRPSSIGDSSTVRRHVTFGQSPTLRRRRRYSITADENQELLSDSSYHSVRQQRRYSIKAVENLDFLRDTSQGEEKQELMGDDDSLPFGDIRDSLLKREDSQLSTKVSATPLPELREDPDESKALLSLKTELLEESEHLSLLKSEFEEESAEILRSLKTMFGNKIMDTLSENEAADQDIAIHPTERPQQNVASDPVLKVWGEITDEVWC